MNQRKWKYIQAWAVEADGKLDVNNILPARQAARVSRKTLVDKGLAKKASVRKVTVVINEGKT